MSWLFVSQKAQTAFLLDASKRLFVMRIAARLVSSSCGFIRGIADEIDNSIATACHLNVAGEGPLAHTPISDWAHTAGAHAFHLAGAPIRLAGHIAEIGLHLDANMVRAGVVVTLVLAVTIACEAR